MPIPCDLCGGTGFVTVENAATGYTGAKRCVCRDEVLAQQVARQERANRGTPMTDGAAMACVKSLSGIGGYFPRDEVARAVIADVLVRMCHTVEQAQFMARKAYELYSGAGGGWDRCGIAGLRQILSALTVPKDGLVLHSTEAYPEGLPDRRPPKPPEPLLLPEGCEPGLPLPAFNGIRDYQRRLLSTAEVLPLELVEAVGAEDLRPLGPTLVPAPKPAAPAVVPLSGERRAELEREFEKVEQQRKASAG